MTSGKFFELNQTSETNDVETTLECPSEPLSLHFADNGSVVVGCKDSEILVFSIRTGKILKKFTKHVTPFAITSIVAPCKSRVYINPWYHSHNTIQCRRLLAQQTRLPVHHRLLSEPFYLTYSSYSMSQHQRRSTA